MSDEEFVAVDQSDAAPPSPTAAAVPAAAHEAVTAAAEVSAAHADADAAPAAAEAPAPAVAPAETPAAESAAPAAEEPAPPAPAPAAEEPAPTPAPAPEPVTAAPAPPPASAPAPAAQTPAAVASVAPAVVAPAVVAPAVASPAVAAPAAAEPAAAAPTAAAPAAAPSAAAAIATPTEVKTVPAQPAPTLAAEGKTAPGATAPDAAAAAVAAAVAASPNAVLSEADATFAPLSVPLHRRRQTCTVLVWLLTPLVCALTALYLVRADGWMFYLFLAYIMWMVFCQKYHKNGGHPQRWFKDLIWWKWMADYFPIRLHKTAELPPDRSYIFGYHPHGIISLGAFCNFSTNGTGFAEKFPGINLRLLTLTTNFRIPFYGFYLTALGICDASPESCNAILKQGKGNSLLLVLGGAKESLDAHPGTADLTLRDRKGFVKIALMTGAALVPVFGFGETDLYDQVDNPQGSKLRAVQEVLQTKLGFALPLVKGRGVFNYRAGLLPHRKALDAVVGAPIACPKLTRDQITPEVLDQYHRQYLDALQKLYDDHKNVYAPKRRKSMSIVR